MAENTTTRCPGAPLDLIEDITGAIHAALDEFIPEDGTDIIETAPVFAAITTALGKAIGEFAAAWACSVHDLTPDRHGMASRTLGNIASIAGQIAAVDITAAHGVSFQEEADDTAPATSTPRQTH